MEEIAGDGIRRLPGLGDGEVSAVIPAVVDDRVQRAIGCGLGSSPERLEHRNFGRVHRDLAVWMDLYTPPS